MSGISTPARPVLDEDDFASNSASQAPSQRSTKNFVLAQIGTPPDWVFWADGEWGSRSVDAPFAVFISTHDVAATAPNDLNLASGDVWLRHPDAGD